MTNEMKKNKKMVLALVIVAALAMVSVAAVAVHSEDSSAAGTGTYWQLSSDNALVIDETSTTSYNFNIISTAVITPADGVYVCPIVITPNSSYTGTLSIGTLDNTVLSKLVFTSYAAIELSNAASMNLTAVIVVVDGEVSTAFFFVGNDASVPAAITVVPAVSASSTVGSQIILGNPVDASVVDASVDVAASAVTAAWAEDATSFTGTITAGDMTVTASNIAGAIVGVAADGTGCISGNIIAGYATDADDEAVDASIEFGGTVTVQLPESMSTSMLLYVPGSPGVNVLTIGVAKAADDGTEPSSAQVKVIIAEDETMTIGTEEGGIVIVSIGSNADVEISGTIHVVYTDIDNFGMLSIAFESAIMNFVTDDGMIIYELGPVTPTFVLGTDIPSMNSAEFTSAFYVETDATGTTYYFTTLKNAVQNGTDIYIVGHPYILIDSLEIPEGKNVYISEGSQLQVGDEKNSPTLTINGGNLTNLNVDNAVTDPTFYVKNGQVEFVPADSAPNTDDLTSYPVDAPWADVKIERPDKVIFTDVATALNTLSQSGDTINLLKDAELQANATVKSGVILQDADGAVLIIPEGKELTVQGTVNMDNGGEIGGVLNVANGGTVNVKSGVGSDETGKINVQSGGSLILDNGSISPGGVSPGALLSLTIADGGSVSLINSSMEVDGFTMGPGTGAAATLTVDDDSTFTVDGTMEIGTEPTVMTVGSNIAPNSALITGIVTLGPDATATVWGNSSVLMDNFASGAVSTTYWVGGNIYKAVYYDVSNVPSLLPAIYPDFKDVIIKDWNNDKMLNGLFLSIFLQPANAPAPSVGDEGWDNLYAKYEPRMYDVTLSFTPGVTWVVNGIQIDGSNNPASFAYGTKVTVQAIVQPGYTGTPVIMDGSASVANPYTINSLEANHVLTIKGDSVKVDNGGGNNGGNGEKTYGGLTLIEILLIIIVIIIAIIAIIVAIRLMRS